MSGGTEAGRVDVELQQRPGGTVARVTLDNRTKLNTLNSRLMNHFAATVAELGRHEGLRAVVLTGAGDKAFIGGADIGEMAALDGTRAETFITLVHRCCRALRDLPVPVIARIDGYALGAGLEIAAACDVRIASTRAVFGMPEVKVGIPSVVEAALLPGLIGWGRTRELLLFGDNIDAATAERWGLVERLVAADELDATIERRLAVLMENGPRAVRLQKQLIREWEDLPIARAVAVGITAFARAFSADEPTRMLGAFATRKRPNG